MTVQLGATEGLAECVDSEVRRAQCIEVLHVAAADVFDSDKRYSAIVVAMADSADAVGNRLVAAAIEFAENRSPPDIKHRRSAACLERLVAVAVKEIQKLFAKAKLWPFAG